MAAKVSSQSMALEVVVPDTATVARKHETPLREKLTLAAKGDSETVPLNKVKSVDFERDVWIKGQSLPSVNLGDAEAYFNRGNSKYQLGDYQGAIADLVKR